MPRSNWRPPAGLPDYQSPVAVEDDQDNQQLPEAEPGDESLSRWNGSSSVRTVRSFI